MAGKQITGMLNCEEYPQFFKIYMPDHCSAQLSIPPAFIKYFEGIIPLKVILVTCGKMSWEVDMDKIDDNVFLKSGWEKFVQDNSLQLGDFLLFYYNGGSKIFVTISGKNNCLKEVKLANNKREQQPKYIQEIDTNNTGEEQKRADAQESKLSFSVKIPSSYMRLGFLHTPRDFYAEVKELREKARLQHSGRTWDVKVVKYGERIRFDGWKDFANDNCLAVGDTCCFKMIDIKPDFYLLDVSFLREL
ncbi:B3 domain-containing protein At1g16640-like [Rutidosis leptorrhynchoides]|uniref:B3 domain-containing protein At1g16640-like n=1 Tax=Rutidosis leptorrhynchoides TaxID=125765 RepID=UPI003A99A6DD